MTGIDQYTEPGEMMGQKISRVTYAYTITDLPPWTANDGVKANLSGLDKVVASAQAPLKETRAMVLTNNGWVHERLIAK
ncbi:hypothetical protein D3C80_2022840 [compost metagenome]